MSALGLPEPQKRLGRYKGCWFRELLEHRANASTWTGDPDGPTDEQLVELWDTIQAGTYRQRELVQHLRELPFCVVSHHRISDCHLRSCVRCQTDPDPVKELRT